MGGDLNRLILEILSNPLDIRPSRLSRHLSKEKYSAQLKYTSSNAPSHRFSTICQLLNFVSQLPTMLGSVLTCLSDTLRKTCEDFVVFSVQKENIKENHLDI